MNGALRQEIKRAIDQRRRMIVRDDQPRRATTHCDQCAAELPTVDARGHKSRQRFCKDTCRKRWNDRRRR